MTGRPFRRPVGTVTVGVGVTAGRSGKGEEGGRDPAPDAVDGMEGETSMADPKIDLTGAPIPHTDGDINEYVSREAAASDEFDRVRKVIFINGMANTGTDHAKSALALSLVQMCAVIGVYNQTSGAFRDFLQCVADKNQFNGPLSLSAANKVAVGSVFRGGLPVETARAALARNPAQVKLFDLLRRPENRLREIFAHSQGNLILSNALQAIAAVDGPESMSGRKVHTFGSPSVNWPAGITKLEHGFTWDPVTFLAGFDFSWSISKVGMPGGSLNPITHGFLEYLKRDPAFVVNRFRVGGLGVTFNMDESGLADALVAMGTNTRRVLSIFEYLNENHNSDADDVAVLYVERAKPAAATVAAIKADRPLVALLIRIMDEGWTSAEEKKAIEYLRTL